eukprot:scaffold32493_cov59-Attheya_sp.AAC.2
MLHVLTAYALWSASWTTLVDQWGATNPSGPGVFNSVKLGWKSLLAPDLAFYPPNLCMDIQVQSKIGWHNFLDGFVAHQWGVIQVI